MFATIESVDTQVCGTVEEKFASALYVPAQFIPLIVQSPALEFTVKQGRIVLPVSSTLALPIGIG